MKIWDATTREIVRDEPSESDAVMAVAWRPDGRCLAAGYDSGAVRIWDLEGEAEPLSFVAHRRFRWTNALAWSPTGDRLATCGDDTVELWDGLSPVPVQTLRTAYRSIDSLVWSPDGRFLAAGCMEGSEGKLNLWDMVNGVDRGAVGGGFDGRITDCAWSSHGRWLAASSRDQRVKIWNTETWEEVPGYQAGHEGMPYSLAWNPEVTLLASAGGNGIVKVWNPLADAAPVLLRGHTREVWDVAWDPKGTLLASVGQDGSVKIWDPACDRYARRLPGEYPATWSSDGRLLAMEDAANGVVRIVDALSGESVSERPYPGDDPQDLAFHPSRPWIAIAAHGETGSSVWDWDSDAVVYRIGEETDTVHCVDWSPDGTLLAATVGKGRCSIFDGLTGAKVEELREIEGRVVRSAWSPDATYLATTAKSGSVRIWDRVTWGESRVLRRRPASNRRGKPEVIFELSWSPDGARVAAAGGDGVITVWNVVTGKELKVRGHSSVRSLAWSPDGKRLASGGEDRTVKIWDAREGREMRELLTLHGHRWRPASLQWHPDGKRLLSADGFPHSVRIWDASPAYDQ